MRLAATAVLLLCSACAGTSSDAAAPVAPAPAAKAPVFGNRAPGPAPPYPTTQAAPAGDFELRMTRGACYGICPSYSLTVHADGRVDYQGTGHVTVGGAQHGQADPAALAKLRAELSDPGFALWGEYVHGAPACGPWATDMPGVSIEAYAGGRWHHIGHDFGCRDAPAELRRLEQEIDNAANSGQWSGAGAVR